MCAMLCPLFLSVIVMRFASAAPPRDLDYWYSVDSAKFERWSHFKDYGVPAVRGKDAVNSAAIADGTCRLKWSSFQDGFYFWHYPSRVDRVLKALADAPATSNPSYFTISVNESLTDACSDKNDKFEMPAYEFKSLSASIQNWYHALCAPSTDPSWNNKFDPAYQPQQMALTTSFMCIVACSAGKRNLTAEAMASVYARPDRARDEVCSTLPWGGYGNLYFTKAASVEDLAQRAASLLDKPCQCRDSYRQKEYFYA